MTRESDQDDEIADHMTCDWPRYYILVGRTPIAVDLTMWGEAYETRARAKADPWRVAFDVINNDCHVSTVFLSLDRNFGSGDPLLFETLIMGGPLDGDGQRYTTYEKAERGHAEWVARTLSIRHRYR